MTGTCPTSQTCDFESGLCDWIIDPPSNPNSQYTFKNIYASNSAVSWINGKYDHSTESNFGHFLEAANGMYSHILYVNRMLIY